MSNLFIIAAPSGCGKTTLVDALLKTQNIYTCQLPTLHANQELVKLMASIITLSLKLTLKK